MVRKGSSVRVRQRASANCLHAGYSTFGPLTVKWAMARQPAADASPSGSTDTMMRTVVLGKGDGASTPWATWMIAWPPWAPNDWDSVGWGFVSSPERRWEGASAESGMWFQSTYSSVVSRRTVTVGTLPGAAGDPQLA